MSAAISLETAREHLEEWLEAELKVTQGQSYTIGKRALTRADLAEIRKTIDYWENKVNMLETRGGRRNYRIVPRDW